MEQLVSQIRRRCTVEEYFQLDRDSSEKHEYRDGAIIAMAGGTESHSLVASNVIRELGSRLKGSPCKVYEGNLRVRIARSVRYSYPDAFVICNETQFDEDDRSQTTITNPRVVVEVLSPSTELSDRGEKFARYIEIPSLEEYVLVSQSKPRVETFYRQSDGTWSFAYFDGLEGSVRLRSLDVDLPMREIYTGVTFLAEIEIKVVAGSTAVTEEAAGRIIASARAKHAVPGRQFSLFLSGGSTPKALYQLLAAEPYRSRVDWSRVRIYFGDERCVSPDHADSNYLMAQSAMLSKLPIPAENIHRMRGEIDPETAAIEYGKMLKLDFPEGGPDMVLLGMGPDGHTASLFPGTEALNETHHRCVANFVPKFNTWRITATYPFLNSAEKILIMLAGGDKAGVLKEVLQGARDVQRLPIQGIAPVGELTWLLDSAAAAGLDR